MSTDSVIQQYPVKAVAGIDVMVQQIESEAAGENKNSEIAVDTATRFLLG